jgi:tetratricopeptide (TPR) repeat protein
MIPIGFALDYGRRPDLVLQDTVLLLRATIPFVAAGALAWQWHRRPTPALRLLCILLTAFALALLPTLGLLQFAYQFFSIVCDRYAYLAMLAPAIGIAAIRSKFTTHRYRNLIPGIVLVFLAWQSLQLVQTWSNERTLFSHSLESQPNGAVALVGLSNDTANSGNWRGTVPLLKRAQEALPEWARPHNNMGTTHMNLGDPAAAAGEYAAAIHLFPAYALAHCNRCAALTELKRLDEAIVECLEALRLSPEYQQAFINLGAALVAAKRLPEAVQSFAKASALAPTAFAPRHKWAMTLQEAGRWSESLEQLNILRRQYPAHLRLVFDLGKSLVMLGRTAEAQQLYVTYAKLAPDAAAQAQITAALQSLNNSGTRPPGSVMPPPLAP